MRPLSRIPVGGWFHKRKHPTRSRSWWPHPSTRSNDFLAGPAAHSITHHRQMKSWMRCWVSLNRKDQLLNTDDNILFERSLKWSKEKNQKHINIKNLFRTMSNQFKNQPLQLDTSFNTKNGGQSNVNSITSPQGVTDQVWGSTFIKKEHSLSNLGNPPPVRNLGNKYTKI